MDRRFKNAIYINFSSLMSSEATKLIIGITLLISIGFSFSPMIFELINGEANSSSLDMLLFTMGISIVFLVFTVLLITRIGAQVGFEKGSKETEIILTSISRKQLYYAHIISSELVAVLSVIIIILPVAAALIIQKPNVTVTIPGLTAGEGLFLVSHALLTIFVMINLAIMITSLVKKSEDTGPFLLGVLFPSLLSNIYFVIKWDLFEGFWGFLNYIPLTSLIPVIGKEITDEIDTSVKILIIVSDVFWIGITLYLGKRCFVKNISE